MDTPKTETQVDRQLKELAESVNELVQSQEIIVTRLRRVMRDEPPAERCGPDAKQVLTPLADDLREITARVRSVILGNLSILSRLEL